jgi:hypothetical protein
MHKLLDARRTGIADAIRRRPTRCLSMCAPLSTPMAEALKGAASIADPAEQEGAVLVAFCGIMRSVYLREGSNGGESGAA